MIIMVIYTIFLFVLLTPSILVRLPKKGNKYTVAFVHGLIFAIIYHFTHKMVHNIVHKENFDLYDDKYCNTILKQPFEQGQDTVYYKNNKNICRSLTMK